MSRLDPRAALVILVAATSAVLFGGALGLIAIAVASVVASSAASRIRSLARALTATLPLATAIAVLDGLAGEPARGVGSAARLLTLVALFAAFAASADGDRLVDGLLALRVPFAITFVLVTGARFVPVVASDIGELRDAARLRGLPLDGPVWRQLAGWRALLVPLLVTTVRRGLQLGEAMELRGFGLPGRAGPVAALRWTPRDSLACLLALLALVALVAADRLVQGQFGVMALAR